MLYIDNLFRLYVYLISIYLILIYNSLSINICGWVIIIAHIYKDITNLQKWPEWCEYIGLILSITLIINGNIIKNYFIICIGLLKLSAHIRQLFLKDNRYYY